MTLSSISRPITLARFDPIDWMTTEEDLFFIGEYFYTVPHQQVLEPGHKRRRMRLDQRLFDAGLVGAVTLDH